MPKLQSGVTCQMEENAVKEISKLGSGGGNTCTKGPHTDMPCPGLEKECLNCKKKKDPFRTQRFVQSKRKRPL